MMLTREELQKYARLSGLNLGRAEKDYFQAILLFVLYQEYGNTLVFKGGTALKKCYGLGRFSEDLDFTCLDKITTIKKIEAGLKRFNLEFETEETGYENGLKITFRIKVPLYTGIRYSRCKLIVDLSFRENVLLKPQIKTIGRFLEEIPSFDVFVMQEREILAEKVRVIMSRTTARDIYDMQFLLDGGTEFDVDLVKKKLDYYEMEWDFKKFAGMLDLKEPIWESELRPLIAGDNVPKFKEARKFILEKIKYAANPTRKAGK